VLRLACVEVEGWRVSGSEAHSCQRLASVRLSSPPFLAAALPRRCVWVTASLSAAMAMRRSTTATAATTSSTAPGAPPPCVLHLARLSSHCALRGPPPLQFPCVAHDALLPPHRCCAREIETPVVVWSSPPKTGCVIVGCVAPRYLPSCCNATATTRADPSLSTRALFIPGGAATSSCSPPLLSPRRR